jgi:uncharacterized protein YrzB (UPF0473 family)
MKEIQNENQIVLLDDMGNEKVFEIMLTYNNEETGKNYVFYYYPNVAEDDDVEVSVACYDETTKELFAVESDDEYDMLEELYNTYIDEQGLGIDE